MRLVIFEPGYRGHRLNYVRHLVTAFADMGLRPILVLMRGVEDTEEYRQNLTPLADRFELDASTPPMVGGPTRIARDRVAAIKQIINRHRPDRLHIPYADGVLQILGWRQRLGQSVLPAGLPAEGIFHHTSFRYPAWSRSKAIRRPLDRMGIAAAGMDRLWFVDLIEYEWAEDTLPPRAGRPGMLPDPVETPILWPTSDARRALGLADDRPVVGMVGRISAGKGAVRLIDAVLTLKPAERPRLLLVGRHDPAVRQRLESADGRGLLERGELVSVDEFVPYEQIDQAVCAMDAMAVLHQRHPGISSIAIRAAAADRPIIASMSPWTNRVVRDADLGWLVEGESPETLAEVLRDVTPKLTCWSASAAHRRFVKFHHPQNFAHHLIDGVCRDLGRTPPPTTRWSDVTGSTEPSAQSPEG